ncbi:hypothetical protein [Pseudoalteromonas phenolica]|uniref:hypothetical protein n=1 Tax=Pseudoalteromonas phenolica TaxID=161398 RepID=UPI001485FEFE|nr:hypothetical protein [Pseudoalteromonas phenolica]
MDRIIMSYYTSSLLLTTVGTLLSIQTPPFYADIIILCAALVFAVTGTLKTRKDI